MAEQGKPRGRTVFSVRLDGLELPSEITLRIAVAVRRAILAEMAEVDLVSGFRVQDLAALESGGGTQGIAIVADVAED